jgi:hypothetical protein
MSSNGRVTGKMKWEGCRRRRHSWNWGNTKTLEYPAFGPKIEIRASRIINSRAMHRPRNSKGKSPAIEGVNLNSCSDKVPTWTFGMCRKFPQFRNRKQTKLSCSSMFSNLVLYIRHQIQSQPGHTLPSVFHCPSLILGQWKWYTDTQM